MSAQALFNSQVQTLDHYLYKLQGTYKHAVRTRNDIIECLRVNPALQPRAGPLANTAGAKQVVYLAGTIPILYNGVQYNIPVNIWIVDAYPSAPPIAYVTPTPDMIVKPKHRHVDSAGMTYLPYLSSWSSKTSSLRQLIATMSTVFGHDPPVRAKPKGSRASAATTASTASASSSKARFEDPGAVIKRNAIQAVTEKLRRELKSTYERLAGEIDTLMSAGSTDPRAQKQAELRKIQSQTAAAQSKCEELTKWLAVNDTGKEVDIDKITDPRDNLSQQLLYLVAADAAIEDFLYYAEKALMNGAIDTQAFLKTYRSIAREQYMKRATMKLIHEKQRSGK